jgi:VIT1/CCC1 family predicted Fe2+/Mn2+ transporter
MGGNPWTAAGFSFALFALGAIFPVLPFLLTTGAAAVAASIGVSALALAAIGVVTSLFNGRAPWFSAARQMVFGCAAAGVTYGVGALLGVSLS